jgi:hypothetical protein
MTEDAPAETLVVFEDRADSRWLAWLRPGFRHCYCLVRAERGWIAVDPLLSGLHVRWLDIPDDFNLTDHYVRHGRTVLTGTARFLPTRLTSIRPITCVEIVKRVLGMVHVWAWTPHQLHRVLLDLGWTQHKPIDVE